MTPFRFDHDFRTAASANVFRAYFDPELEVEQDRLADVAKRETLELDDRADTLRRVCKVAPRRQLPAIVRPFVAGDLSFREEVVWRKAEDLMEMRIEPAVLGGRVEILATYRVVQHGEIARRTFEGTVSVQLRLVGGRVERYIVEDLERSFTRSAACTQGWLDRHIPG